MSYKVTAVEAVDAYAPYRWYSRYTGQDAYAPSPAALLAQWAAFYRKGVYPIGSTPLDLQKWSQPFEARHLVAFQPYPFVRAHYRKHPVFGHLPRYSQNKRSSGWKNVFTTRAPQHDSPEDARSVAPMSHPQHLPPFFAKAASSLSQVPLFQSVQDPAIQPVD